MIIFVKMRHMKLQRKLLNSATSLPKQVVKISNFTTIGVARLKKCFKVGEISNISEISEVVKITNFNTKNVLCHFVPVKEEWYPNFS